ncbi:MAG TPA: helix-hairpin-helix domain-containing protein [Gemmataceae bacterium]|nr:helix-hairpin-helix domain-containing protein [Gemmataceae bacterium]
MNPAPPPPPRDGAARAAQPSLRPASPPLPPRDPRSLTAWSGSVQLAMAFLLGLATAVLAGQALGFWRWGGRPTEVQSNSVVYRIDLNRADRAELLLLPNIGDTLARRIEERRSQTGGFQSIEELGEIQGIGPARLEQLRPWVYVDTPEETTRDPGPSVPTAGAGYGSKKIAHLTESININQATAEQLQRLPGIGPKLSQRIVEERQRGPFRSADDLRRVPGIGPKTIERLRPHVTTGGGLPTVARTP